MRFIFEFRFNKVVGHLATRPPSLRAVIGDAPRYNVLNRFSSAFCLEFAAQLLPSRGNFDVFRIFGDLIL